MTHNGWYAIKPNQTKQINLILLIEILLKVSQLVVVNMIESSLIHFAYIYIYIYYIYIYIYIYI